MGNQWHIMVCTSTPSPFKFSLSLSVFQADSLDRKVEKPLRHHLDEYKSVFAVSVPSDPVAHNLTHKIT